MEKGIIKKIKIEGNFFNEKDISEIEIALVNIPHEEIAIRKVLGQYPIGEYFNGISSDDLLNAMF